MTGVAGRATSTACLVALAVACSIQSDRTANNIQGAENTGTRTAGHTPAQPERDNPALDLDRPPPVTVHDGNRRLLLRPHTWCYLGACADGIPPANPPGVRGGDQLLLDLPLDGWSLHATFTPVGLSRPRERVTPQPTERGLLLRPPTRFRAKAGVYDVWVFAHGEGDISAVFRWTPVT